MRELERKYLVKPLDIFSVLLNFDFSIIRQYYIFTKPEMRVRLSKNIKRNILGTKSTASITIKTREEVSIRGLDREEVIIKIKCRQFKELKKLAIVNSEIYKHRYYIPYGAYLIEYDQFHDRHDGLVIAEVEFKDEEHMDLFNPPEWFLINVSNDPTFLNINLALHGMPTKHLLEKILKHKRGDRP